MNPIMWVLERTISTPSTHWAHHGKHLNDENTHYKGNYGNLLFIWDMIFGTAKITRKYPKEVGVENLSDVSALTQLFWPIFRSPQDTKTEKAILESLKTLDKTMTVIISHRRSALESADMLLVLRSGELVEKGPPAQVAVPGSLYMKIMESVHV